MIKKLERGGWALVVLLLLFIVVQRMAGAAAPQQAAGGLYGVICVDNTPQFVALDQPVPTSTPTRQPTPTKVPSLTPTTGATSTPAPVGDVTTIGVVYNPTGGIRIRACPAATTGSPINCPQQTINGTSQYVTAGSATRGYKLRWPFENNREVWVRISPDGASLLWISICYGGTQLALLYPMAAYASQGDPVAVWQALKVQNQLPPPESCFYPAG